MSNLTAQFTASPRKQPNRVCSCGTENHIMKRLLSLGLFRLGSFLISIELRIKGAPRGHIQRQRELQRIEYEALKGAWKVKPH